MNCRFRTTPLMRFSATHLRASDQTCRRDPGIPQGTQRRRFLGIRQGGPQPGPFSSSGSQAEKMVRGVRGGASRKRRESRCGRSIGAMLRGSGFSDVMMTASLNCHSSGPSAQQLSEQMAGLPVLGQAVEAGIITQEESQEITAAWLQWGTHQDAFLARPWGEAMGWKT